MNNRNGYDDYEDVRMLKWLARKHDDTAPLGIQLWKGYVQKWGGHSAQSLNGRMRRQIIPNITHYLNFLKLSDLSALYMMFKERLASDTRKIIKRHILRLREIKEENPEDMSEDDEELERPLRKPQDRNKTIGTYHHRVEPPDDMDEDVPPLSTYRRKTLGDPRELSNGPSTSAAGPSSPSKQRKTAVDIRRRRDPISDDEEEEQFVKDMLKRKVIGEVSSTANLQSDEDDEEIRRIHLKQQKKLSIKSPITTADATIRNVVGVVSSSANHEEPTSSGRPVIRSPDSFSAQIKQKPVVSDDDRFTSPKPSSKAPPKKSPRKSNSHMIDPDELEEDDDEIFLTKRPSHVRPEKEQKKSQEVTSEIRQRKEASKRRPESEDDDEDLSPARPQAQKIHQKQKEARRHPESEDEDDEVSPVPPKASPIRPKKKPSRRRQESDEEEDDVSPVRPQASQSRQKKKEHKRRPVSDEDEDDFSPVRAKKSKRPATPEISDEEEEVVLTPKTAPSSSKKQKKTIADYYRPADKKALSEDDFEMLEATSPKKMNGGASPKKAPAPIPASQAPAPAAPRAPPRQEEEEEEEDDSDYVSPKSTPRKQKLSTNSEEDALGFKQPTVPASADAADFSEPDDDDYVSRVSSPIPAANPMYSGFTDDDVEQAVQEMQKSTVFTQPESPQKSPRKQTEMSPVKNVSQTPTTSASSSRQVHRHWEEEEERNTEDEEVRQIMSRTQDSIQSSMSPQKSAPLQIEAQVEIQKEKVVEVEAVQTTPKKKFTRSKRRSSDDKDDEEEETEIAKTMRLFGDTPPSKNKAKSPMKSPVVSPPKIQPIPSNEEEDDDLADRIMATIQKRKSETGNVGKEEQAVAVQVEQQSEESEEDEEDEPKEPEESEEPEEQVTMSPARNSRGMFNRVHLRIPIADDLMTSGPLVREDVPPSNGPHSSREPAHTPRRRRPSYTGAPPPKDDRPNYHWTKIEAGHMRPLHWRWQRKPNWLIQLEAEEAGEVYTTPMMSPMHPGVTTEDEEPIAVEEKKKTPRRRKSYSQRTKSSWQNFRRKTRTPKKKQSVDTEDEEEPPEIDTEEDEPVREVDTEEDEPVTSAHSSTAPMPKRARREVLEGEEEAEDLDYFYTIDKLGRKRKWPRKRNDPLRSPLPQRKKEKIVRMLAEGNLHTKTPQQKEQLMKDGVPVKRGRGRPRKRVETPEPYDDPMPGTSSSRVPPFEMQTSMASTTLSANGDADRTFSFQQWNLDMRPVAEQAARSMYTEMFQHLEGRLIPEKELRDIVLGDNVQQLFDKMFKEDEQQGEEDFVIVGVETFSAKKLRLKYFVKIQEQLKRHTTTPHVRSAVLTFFQYFEYTVAATVTGKNFDTYILLMDRLINVALPLATF